VRAAYETQSVCAACVWLPFLCYVLCALCFVVCVCVCACVRVCVCTCLPVIDAAFFPHDSP